MHIHHDQNFAEAFAISTEEAQALRRAVPRLHRWYAARARRLPWRETRDPYAIWVSEVMLQQTQVSTVIPYYERWMRRFPDVGALAEADEVDVLRVWEGLGYYSRARNFQRAARQVVRDHAGRVPEDVPGLLGLPGVGPYTAAAVASIAFGASAAVVDGNVRRVLARLIALDRQPSGSGDAAALAGLARWLLGHHAAATHNQAMMELGALVCLPRAAGCDVCPLAGACKGLRAGDPLRYPPRARRARVAHHHLAAAVVYVRGRLLLARRPYGGMLAGLWDLPLERISELPATEAGPNGTELAEMLGRMLARRYDISPVPQRALPPVRHAYTHLKVTLHPYQFTSAARARRAQDGDDHRWVAPAELAQHPMSKASHKVLSTVSRTSTLEEA